MWAGLCRRAHSLDPQGCSLSASRGSAFRHAVQQDTRKPAPSSIPSPPSILPLYSLGLANSPTLICSLARASHFGQLGSRTTGNLLDPEGEQLGLELVELLEQVGLVPAIAADSIRTSFT